MKIDSRLSKLEQRAKVILRCDWCRYVLRDTPLSEEKKYADDPQSFLNIPCLYCGTEYCIDVSKYDEFERDAAVIHYGQERGAFYRDERAFAASEWNVHRITLKQWRAGDLNKEKVEARKKAKKERRYQQRFEKKKEDRYTRERAELRERADSFLRRMYEEEAEEYGPATFPLADEVYGIEEPDSLGWIPGTDKEMEYEETIARKVLYSARVMEACERVLWGKVLPETEAAINELCSIIHKFEDERAEKAREEEE